MVKRYSRKEQKSDYVKQPKVIENYNKYMGGVNLLDNFVAMYRVQIKGKKNGGGQFLRTLLMLLKQMHGTYTKLPWIRKFLY